MVRARRSTAALALLEAWAMLFLPRTTFWWSAMVSRVPLSRESARTAVHTLDVMWLLSADSIGFGMPTPVNLARRERMVRRLGEWWWRWCHRGGQVGRLCRYKFLLA